jgi:threonine/homoserine/homoserine lactone efflux protein
MTLSTWLPDSPRLVAFAVASVVLALTPGPAVLYLVARTLGQGMRVGLSSVAAVAVGNFGNALAATFGLAALFAASSIAFTVVKYIGAAYLVYLGIEALRGPNRRSDRNGSLSEPRADVEGRAGRDPSRDAARLAIRDGFLVALLNPKTTLFFAAFLPQFIDPAGPAAQQSLVLGALFVAVAATTDVGYVVVTGVAGRPLARLGASIGLGRFARASVYFGLGAWTALSDRGRPQ